MSLSLLVGTTVVLMYRCHKAPPIICSTRPFQILLLLKKKIRCNISYLFYKNLGKMTQNLSSAAVVIGAVRVKICHCLLAKW